MRALRKTQLTRLPRVCGMLAALLFAGAAAGHAGDASVTLHCVAGAGGSVAPSGDVAVSAGDDLVVSIEPAAGYHVGDVRVDGVSVGPVSSYTFVDITAPHTLEADFHIPWATEVVSFVPGTNSEVYQGSVWVSAQAVLGEPSRKTTYGFDDVTMFQPPWMTNQIVSVGAEGALVVTFDHPVRNDPNNPYGVDLLVFGNALFQDVGGQAKGIMAEPGMISVSQDGSNWFTVADAVADSVWPTLAYTDTSAARNVGDGTIPTSFVTPVNPALTWSNKTYPQLVAGYAGAGGGSGVDIGSLGLDWIRYAKIWQPANQNWSTEIDAFADVTPSLGRALQVSSAFGRCAPAAGLHNYTSGVPVTCRVTEPLVALDAGARVACTGWIGTGSVPAQGAGAELRFTIGAPSSIAWQWTTQFWLTVTAETGGTTSLTGGWFTAGAAVDVTATPEAGYAFAGWSGDVTGDTNMATVSVMMDGPLSLVAHFEPVATDDFAAWMQTHGLTNGPPETEGDVDHDEDGMTSRAEWLAGTNPNDDASVFRIIRQGTQAGSNFVTWLAGTAGAEVPCEVWITSNLVEWLVLDAAVSKSPTGTNTWWHAPPVGSGTLHYQVRVRGEN